jgi:hypothetical protein
VCGLEINPQYDQKEKKKDKKISLACWDLPEIKG